MNKSKRIAIIGGGVAGVSILQNILGHQDYTGQFVIDIYDDKNRMGRGQAYRNDSDHLLINVPAGNMSLTENPDGFKDWLKQNNYPVQKFVPRIFFGTYVQSILQELVKENEGIEIITHYATDITRNKNKTYSVYSDEGVKSYDNLFLTVGQMDYNDPYHLREEKHFIYDPYPVRQQLKNVEGSIGIIGTGLSAIDCIRHLIMEEKKEKLYVFSRSGEMPSVRGTEHEIKLKYFTLENIKSKAVNDLVPLTKIVHLFKKEMREHNISSSLLGRQTGTPYEDLTYDLLHKDEVGKLQSLIAKINPLFSDVFKYLSKSDKSLFMSKYHSVIDENHSPMPDEVAKLLVEWMEKDRLLMLDDVEEIQNNHEFIVKTKGEEVKVDVLINATGPVNDILKDRRPLLNNMLERYLITRSEYGGVIIDQDRRVISSRYGTLEGFYAIGALTIGSDYLSNSVEVLKYNTLSLVNNFYKNI